MVWSWLWAACLCLASQPHRLLFRWIASALTVLAQFHSFQYLSREQSKQCFHSPSLVQAGFPEMHYPTETYWPLPAVLCAIRTPSFDSFLILFTCKPRQTGSTGEFPSTKAPKAVICRLPSVYIQHLIGVVNAQSQYLSPVLQMQKKKSCWQLILRMGYRGLWNLPYPHGSGIAVC